MLLFPEWKFLQIQLKTVIQDIQEGNLIIGSQVGNIFISSYQFCDLIALFDNEEKEVASLLPR